jgi:hypothetical protein
MKTFVVTLTLGVLFGSPAFSLPTNGASSIDAARVQALQQCSVMEKKYPQATWGVTQLDVYRACMEQQRQQE